MNTVTRRRAKWIGAAVGTMGALLWGYLHQAEPVSTQSARGQERTGSIELTMGGGPEQLPVAAEEATAQAGMRPATLPPDAGILPVEKITWGDGELEVMAGEVVAKFSPALSQEGRDRLIARMGSRILQENSHSGYVRLKVPEGASVVSFQQKLAVTTGVVSARPNVIMMGAGNKCNTSGAYYNYQWHLGRFNHPTTCSTRTQDPTPVKVAVLDTGVAYENYNTYVQASNLNTVPITSPYDFVNNDAHANDDHQHGTHIATTILGMGSINGVTPGATLMPVKVLDATNRGNEFSLAMGLYWAVDHGAKLINMSLSFPKAYSPSGLLQDAISYATSNGVLMIASSGNEGIASVPYPAAFRDVISVGATRIKRLTNGTLVDERANYSNYGPGLDLMAPGGSLEYDANQDGWPDGILAQSIRPQNPASTGYYFYSGTSQAAALVTGVATWLMASGANSTQARDALLQTATDLGPTGYDTTYGQGLVNLNNAVSFYASQLPTATPSLYANITPVVYKSAGNEWGVAKIRVVRENGSYVANARVIGRWYGSAVADVDSVTDSQGWITVSSPAIADDTDGALFAIEINTIVDPSNGRRVKPMEYYYMSQGLSALLNGALENEATQQSLLAFRADPSDTSLGSLFDLSKLTSCFVIKSVGPTLGTPGVGIVFTPDFIPGLAQNTIPKQEIAIQFSGPQAFGGSVQNNGLVVVYSGGVGLSMMSMNNSGGVGLSMMSMNYLGGVGLSMMSMNRLGGVGLMMMGMSVMPLDSAMVNGVAVNGSAVELVKNEDVGTFLSANPGIDGSGVAFNLLDTRAAANSSDTAAMDAVIIANSESEAEATLDSELGMILGAAEFGGEPPQGLIQDPEE